MALIWLEGRDSAPLPDRAMKLPQGHSPVYGTRVSRFLQKECQFFRFFPLSKAGSSLTGNTQVLLAPTLGAATRRKLSWSAAPDAADYGATTSKSREKVCLLCPLFTLTFTNPRGALGAMVMFATA